MIDKQIGKSNKSSYDNPLAYPVPPVPVSSVASPPSLAPSSNNADKAQVGAGGILKSNFSSNDNPLNSGFYSNQSSQLGGSNTNKFESTSFNQNMSLDAYKKLPLEAYKKKPDGNSPRVVFAAPSPSPASNNFQPPPPQSDPYYNEPLERMKYQPLPPIMPNTLAPSPKPMYGSAPDLYSPRTRSQQLEQTSRDIDLMQNDRNNLRNELDSLSQYPFARRFDPQQSGFTKAESNYNQVSYPPEASMYNPVPQYGRFLETRGAYDGSGDYKLNRDRIVENPNSIHVDVPPYDPIKHKSGYHQGFDYNPWGKPGGGAPLVDPNSGKKYTKKSNILWNDRISLNEDEKAVAIMSMGKNRALSLEEQQREIEAEKQRRKLEEASYKSRTAGDLVTWINYLDDQKAKLANGGRLYRPVGDNKMLREEIRRVEAMKKYHEELGAQMEEKTRNHQLDKLKEDVAGIEHAKTWDDLWGRPGGGAPNQDGKRKRIMDMYQMDATTTNPNNPELAFNNQYREYRGMPYNPQDPDNRSSHKNYYESLQPMRL